MAAFLLRTIQGENALRYADGDPVMVVPDNHVFGRMESLAVWLSEGRAKEDWPGGFAILILTGLSVVAAQKYLAQVDVIGATNPEMQKRRKHNIDYKLIASKLPQAKIDTFKATGILTLPWSNQAVQDYFLSLA